MHVRFFRRKESPRWHSIEELFDKIQNEFEGKLSFDNYTMPNESSGIINRVKNIWFANRNRSFINHVTGHVHYLTLFLPRDRTILTVHDCGELKKHSGIHRFLLWLFWFYLPVKRCRTVTVISESTRNDLIKYVPSAKSKTRIITNCLIGDYQKKLTPFNERCPRILQVGSTPNKNLARIIEALKDVPCELVILGMPDERKTKMLKDYGIKYQVRNKLTRLEVCNLYNSCDMLLFPSTVEGFGLPIIEAQASGIPVVTSNISAMPETAGCGAVFVDPFSPRSINNGVRKVINDKVFRDEIVEKGFVNVRRFQASQIASEYLKLYNEIAESLIVKN